MSSANSVRFLDFIRASFFSRIVSLLWGFSSRQNLNKYQEPIRVSIHYPISFSYLSSFACWPVPSYGYIISGVQIFLQALTKIFFVFEVKILTKIISHDKLLLVYKPTERELHDETSAIIEFKDTYASTECHELGYQTKETALAIISYWTYSIKYTAFQKGIWFKYFTIDQLPFNIDNLSITARGSAKVLKPTWKIGLPILSFFQWTKW